ncbi:MAG: aquaporin [Planctomycetota bacterium]|nr:aquaporin [Planctomycetota bacterium]
MSATRAMLAEFVGTFALMFVGGGAIIVTGGENLVAIAFAHGLILAVMVSATMHISGGQINPAVSIALWLIKKQSWAQAGLFMAAQLVGAIAAALLLKMLLAGAYDVGNIGATLGEFSRAGSEHVSAGKTLGLETIATFFLMFVIMGTAVDKRGVGKNAAIGGFGIGLTVAAAILAIGPATGASLNPARSFGPALVAWTWDMHGAYWAGPIIGAALAALAYRGVFGSGTDS